MTGPATINDVEKLPKGWSRPLKALMYPSSFRWRGRSGGMAGRRRGASRRPFPWCGSPGHPPRQQLSRSLLCGQCPRPGQLTAALAITALVYGIIEAGVGSFTDATMMLALSTAVVSSVAFVVVERRSPSPMLDLTLFRSPSFTATALIALIPFLGLIGSFFALSRPRTSQPRPAHRWPADGTGRR